MRCHTFYSSNDYGYSPSYIAWLEIEFSLAFCSAYPEQSGLIVDWVFAAVDVDECEMIFELDRQGISTILGDKGYIYNENMKNDRLKWYIWN
ncbi:MAG: hypothetical protein PHV59_03480 [Victivallales bacterium]|nr:hypothetical protein [Victivallales bacterium]